jgi:tRNA (cytosine38-C5)-methyltransferase
VSFEDPSTMIPLKLRYFTPREIARLHGFPDEFEFPDSLNDHQKYALLGNSLTTNLVAELLCCLIKSTSKVE